ncbi:MAG: type II toxin-antitoxin system RelE/ParE family toxin [Sphingopyxis sp.]
MTPLLLSSIKMDTHFRVARTDAFTRWFDAMRDRKGQVIIARRIERVAGGNLGDVKSLGGGLSELRVNFGPGYRIYFTFEGDMMVVLLTGGDKSSQKHDIAAARDMIEGE